MERNERSAMNAFVLCECVECLPPRGTKAREGKRRKTRKAIESEDDGIHPRVVMQMKQNPSKWWNDDDDDLFNSFCFCRRRDDDNDDDIVAAVSEKESDEG